VEASAFSAHRAAALVIVVLAAFALSTETTGRSLVTKGAVTTPIALWLGAALVAAVSERWIGRARADLLISVALFVLYVTVDNRPDLGDGSWKVLSTDGTRELWMSSYLAHLFLRGLYARYSTLPLYAPVLGFLVANGVFFLLRSYWRKEDHVPYFLSRAVYVGMGVHIAFFSGFVEVTMPSLVFGLPALGLLFRYARQDDPARQQRLVVLTAALLSLAACVHAQFIGVLPLVFVAIAGRWLQGLPTGVALRHAAVSAAVSVAVFAATAFVTITLLGYEPVTGDATGGFDKKMMPVDFLAAGHRQLVGSALVLLFGLWLVVAIIAVVTGAHRSDRLASALAGVAACQYLAFVVGFGFDLGLPRDGEIMLGLGTISVPAVTSWTAAALRFVPRWGGVAFALVAVGAQVLLLGGFFRL
jgi:hypothetical protein